MALTGYTTAYIPDAYDGSGSYAYDPAKDPYKASYLAPLAGWDSLIPAPQNKPTELGDLNVPGVVNHIRRIIRQHKREVRNVAPYLRADTLEQTCYNVWHWAKTNIRFKLDADGIEQLRTPARSWADRKTGIDCDCFTILISSLLLELGIQPTLVLCEFRGMDGWRHIFAQVQRGNQKYILDANMGQFNQPPPNVSRVMEVGVQFGKVREYNVTGAGLGCPCNNTGMGAAEDGTGVVLDTVYGIGPHTLAMRGDRVHRQLLDAQAVLLDKYSKGQLTMDDAKELRKLRAVMLSVDPVQRLTNLRMMPYVEQILPNGGYVWKKGISPQQGMQLLKEEMGWVVADLKAAQASGLGGLLNGVYPHDEPVAQKHPELHKLRQQYSSWPVARQDKVWDMFVGARRRTGNNKYTINGKEKLTWGDRLYLITGKRSVYTPGQAVLFANKNPFLHGYYKWDRTSLWSYNLLRGNAVRLVNTGLPTVKDPLLVVSVLDPNKVYTTTGRQLEKVIDPATTRFANWDTPVYGSDNYTGPTSAFSSNGYYGFSQVPGSQPERMLGIKDSAGTEYFVPEAYLALQNSAVNPDPHVGSFTKADVPGILAASNVPGIAADTDVYKVQAGNAWMIMTPEEVQHLEAVLKYYKEHPHVTWLEEVKTFFEEGCWVSLAFPPAAIGGGAYLAWTAGNFRNEASKLAMGALPRQFLKDLGWDDATINKWRKATIAAYDVVKKVLYCNTKGLYDAMNGGWDLKAILGPAAEYDRFFDDTGFKIGRLYRAWSQNRDAFKQRSVADWIANPGAKLGNPPKLMTYDQIKADLSGFGGLGSASVVPPIRTVDDYIQLFPYVASLTGLGVLETAAIAAIAASAASVVAAVAGAIAKGLPEGDAKDALNTIKDVSKGIPDVINTVTDAYNKATDAYNAGSSGNAAGAVDSGMAAASALLSGGEGIYKQITNQPNGSSEANNFQNPQQEQQWQDFQNDTSYGGGITASGQTGNTKNNDMTVPLLVAGGAVLLLATTSK